MKSLNFKVSQHVLDRINYYRGTPESGRPTQADFFASAALEKCDRIQQQRAGGLVLTVPMPSIDFMTEEDKSRVMDALTKSIEQLKDTKGIAVDCLIELAAYFKYHLYDISEKQRKSFEAKFIVDLEIEADLDELEDSEFNAIQDRGAKAFEEESEG